MNTDSITDDQLLNLLDNIINESEYYEEDFSGGYIQMTTTKLRSKETYKVVLLFGYKGRNSVSTQIEIPREYIIIYTRAILLKLASIQIKDIGADFNQLNRLLNNPVKEKKIKKKEEVLRSSYDTSYEVVSNLINLSNLNINISSILLSSTKIQNFIDVKEILAANAHHKMVFEYNSKEYKVHTNGIPYAVIGGKDLSRVESDNFFKTLLKRAS